MATKTRGAKKSAIKGTPRAKPKAFARLPAMRVEETKKRGRPVIYQDLYPEIWVRLFDAYGGLEGLVVAVGLRPEQHNQVRRWAKGETLPGAVTRRKISDLALHKGLPSPFED
jgi:hypothetical protein